MSKHLADAAARRVIEQRLDLNLFVEAGAGSGKTESLARRMAAGIVSGQYEVEQMAAVTFTRKAAAELRGRFQKVLEQSVPGATADARARIQHALSNLEHLFAGTIHAFCAHLLRERPVEARIAPGFTELEEQENEAFQRQAWRDYLRMLRASGSPELAELQQAGVTAKDLDDAFGVVCTFDEVTFEPGTQARPDPDEARKAAKALWASLKKLLPEERPADNKCSALDRAYKFAAVMRNIDSGRTSDVAAALQCWEKPPKVTMKWWRLDGSLAEQRSVREKVEKLTAAFQEGVAVPFLAAWRQYVYRLAITVLTGARDHARDERRRALVLNFADLLTAAATLLRDNPAVRRAMQKKYRWLLVDEFQDTDPIQAEVMLLLAANEHDAASSSPDPYALPLRPGALFVVGDPKQSIYRFRRADIDVYNRVREVIVANGGQVVPLTTSFRARPALCEWNNEVFGALLPAAATQQQAAFSPLEPDPAWRAVGASDGPDERGLRMLTVPADVERGQVKAWEADAIARYIRREVDAGNAKWSDFLVLTRLKKGHLTPYAEAMRALDIPVDVPGDGAFGASPFVAALIKLLHVLGDPGDTTAIVGVLRGPLFGISDRELFDHRQQGGYFSIPSSAHSGVAGKTGRVEGTKVDGAFGRLGQFLRLVRSLPLAAAVDRIVDDTGIVALAAASVPNAEPAAAVLRVVDLVRTVAERGGTLSEACEAVADAADSEDVESVPLEPGRRDVVRVMNLHKAKGLEARVVFLADPFGLPRARGASVRIVREGSVARGYLAISRPVNEYHSEVIAEPADWTKHQEAEAAYVQAEETRLLYVAATRARELLVLSRWDGESTARRAWGALDAFLGDATDLEVPSLKPSRTKVKTDLSAKARARAAEERARRFQQARRPTWDVTSMTGGEHAQKPKAKTAPASAGAVHTGSANVDVVKAGGGPETLDAGSGVERRADAGVAWGSLVHGLLEYAGRHPNAERRDIERLARWLVVEHKEAEPVVPEAIDLVMRLREAPFWNDLQAGGDVHVEVPFAVRVEPGQSLGGIVAGSCPTIVHGVMDLVHRADNGWRILDYKTDLAHEDEALLAARHGAQLSTYRAAWEKATGEPVSSTGIVALRSLKVVQSR